MDHVPFLLRPLGLLALIILLPCSLGAESPLLQAAKVAEIEGHYEKAERNYRLALKQSPESTTAMLGLARNLARLGYCQAAAESLAHANISVADKQQEDRWLGICYFRTGEFEKAIARLTAAAQLKSNDRDLQVYLARTYAAKGDNEQSLQTLNAWTARYGDDSEILYWRGKLYEQLSEQTFQQMEAAAPGSYIVLQIQGNQFVSKKDYPRALAAFRSAAAAKPDAPGLHYAMGNVYWRTSKWDEAKDELEKELAINPFHALANYELGDISVKHGEARKAVAYLQRALAADHALVEAHRTLGNAYLLQKEYEKALAEFQRVASERPMDTSIHALLATTYRRMGRMQEGEREVQTYERLNKTSMSTEEKAAADRLRLQQHPTTP